MQFRRDVLGNTKKAFRFMFYLNLELGFPAVSEIKPLYLQKHTAYFIFVAKL